MKYFYLFKNLENKNGMTPVQIWGYAKGEEEASVAKKLGLNVEVERTVQYKKVKAWKKSEEAKTVYYLVEIDPAKITEIEKL